VHQMIPVEEIRSDLLPELEQRYGEIFCQVRNHRLRFIFRTEESAICGQLAINAYIEKTGLPGHTINGENLTVILIIKSPEDNI
jgi:hypothetical protein